MPDLCESCRQRPADYRIPFADTSYLVCSSCWERDMDNRRYEAYVEEQIAEFGLGAD